MIIINPKYENIRQWLNAMPTVFEKDGVVAHDSRNLIKKFTAPDGTIVYVKRYHVPGGINRFVYSWGIRKPKGLRAYTYPQILLGKGISTPEPVAYIDERHFGLLGYSYFISVQCPYEHTMYEIGNAPEALSNEIAIHLAHFTANMHERNVLHLDYSPGNILWEKREDGYYFSIVDTNRMYFGPVNMRHGCANFKRLWGSKRFFITLVREYARVRNYSPDEAEAIAIIARSKFWKHYQRKHIVKFKLEL